MDDVSAERFECFVESVDGEFVQVRTESSGGEEGTGWIDLAKFPDEIRPRIRPGLAFRVLIDKDGWRIEEAKGMVWHIGTNDGTVPFCAARMGMQAAGAAGPCWPIEVPMHVPNAWCPKCSDIFFEVHGRRPPDPMKPCAEPKAACAGAAEPVSARCQGR